MSELVRERKPVGLGRICSNCKSQDTQIYITRKGYPHTKWIKDGQGGYLCHKCYRNTLYLKGKRAPSNPANLPRHEAIKKHTTTTICYLCGSSETYHPVTRKYPHWYRYHSETVGLTHICAKCYWKQRRRKNGEFQDFKAKLLARICSNCNSNKTQITITKKGYPHRKWIGDGKGGWLCHNCAKRITYKKQELLGQRRRLMNNPRFHWARMSLRNHKHNGYEVDPHLFDEIIPMAMTANNCALCDVPLTWGYLNGKYLNTTPSIDRLDNGRTLTKDNIQIVCFACNTMKRTRTQKEFIDYCTYVANKFKNQ